MAADPLRRAGGRLARVQRWLAPVRVRLTLAAVAVVALTLVLGSVVLVLVLRDSLLTNLATSAELRAADVAALVRSDRLPATIPQPRNEEEAALAQVVDETGRVIAASTEAEDEGRFDVFSLAPGDRIDTRFLERPLPDDTDDFVVVALRADGPAGARVVWVAASLEQVEEAQSAMVSTLVVGLPVVLAILGAAAWFVVGRALRPVESLRAEVAEISAHDPGRRLAPPATDDEIGRLARTLNEMLDRLGRASDRQRRFVADASHELKSPLASAQAQLEVGLAWGERTDWPTTATEVVAEHRRMGELLADLLFLARADEGLGPGVGQPEEVDLDDLVLAEVASLRSRSVVEVDITGVSAGRVVGDGEALRRTVRNLLENAEAHATTTVAVELGRRGSEVELVVADDGPGIPTADRQRVFDRFTRLDDARTRERGGTGLGLAIAREVVVGHGGTIGVLDTVDGEHGPGGGARIAVRLPAADG